MVDSKGLNIVSWVVAVLITVGMALIAWLVGPWGNAPRGGPLITHDAYVWQRAWNDDVRASVAEALPGISRLRVLAAQFDAEGRRVSGLPDHRDSLAEREVVVVVRLHGSRLGIEPRTLADELSDAVASLTATGARVAAIELDHDSATAALDDYRRFIEDLRALDVLGLPIWITALPDWRNSQDLETLLKATDLVTLQVHAVLHPDPLLMDPVLALDWLLAFDRRSPVPVHVALPTYALSAGRTGSGDLLFVAGEGGAGRRAEREGMLFADPLMLADFLTVLGERRWRRLDGVAWFRLPVPGDRFNIGPETLAALVAGQRPVVDVEVAAIPTGNRVGLYDLVLVNGSRFDAVQPSRLVLPDSCTAWDGASGYRRLRPEPWLVNDLPGLLRAGERLPVGWARCDDFPEVQL